MKPHLKHKKLYKRKEKEKMITDYQTPSCESTGMANVSMRKEVLEESPKIPEIHLAFGNLRNKLDSVNSRLESIIHILNGGDYSDKDAIKEVEILPHQMGLCSNFEVLEKRIDKTSEMIENLYSIFGIGRGKFVETTDARGAREESPSVSEIHIAFCNLRDKLNDIDSRLDSIVCILGGDGRDEDEVKEIEILPHQMGLCSNFEVLEKRIDKASEEIENLYSILGMEQGKIY